MGEVPEVALLPIREVSVVVPVYRSAETVRSLVDELATTLDQCAARWEVILVDDGSPDGSWGAVRAATKDVPHVIGLRLMRNYGQHNALLAGIRAARYGITITLDDDLQNPPGEIPKLISKLEQGHDVVYGVPAHEQHQAWRMLASQATKFALKEALGAGATVRDISAFRAFHTRLRDAFATFDSPFVSVDVLLTWGAKSFVAVSVEQRSRSAGESTYTFRKLVVHSFNMITGFTTRPLQIASIMGFACTVFGGAVLCAVLINYAIRGGTVPGFTFLASIVCLFSGAQLFALGVIGEYLARMHFRLMERPPYIVGESTVVVSAEHSPTDDGDRTP